ncbi:hypothetical protein CYLTODRAFT_239018 [Cylindrobasidium torrendii FP15055 ss-10]|uniref:DUF7770 domain-containing protein n=1 Tax=Cylindrobasidium torrendii FP15055 ss-10 TaxID=1314674 RepID=A0A0D7BUQ0_9AGAR|nr:hypothetical protein CYLTODRAFT_239018 [Cylindrobasidium torrendii FP15055 ss-10]
MTSLGPNFNVGEYIDRYPFAGNWNTEDFHLSMLNLRVQGVHFCAAGHDNDNDSRAQPVNHWMFFLQTSNASSVRVSIGSGETTNHPGLISLSSKNYVCSMYASEVVSCDFLRGGVTVEAIFRLLISLRRDFYRFADEHMGCRWWTYQVARDFEQAGWIAAGSAAEVYKKASYYYPPRRRDAHGALAVPVICPIKQGVFF